MIIIPSCMSLSTSARFGDPWSGHSSVIPWIGGWSSGGCCHGNCLGNSRKGMDDCLYWRVLDERQGPLYNHGSVGRVPRDKKGNIWGKRRRGKSQMGKSRRRRVRLSCQIGPSLHLFDSSIWNLTGFGPLTDTQLRLERWQTHNIVKTPPWCCTDL